MIIDSLKNCSLYYGLNPLFKDAFEHIKSLNFSNLEVGKTELIDKDLFVMITDTNLKTKENAKLEVHNKYIDIQVPISKVEGFGWKSRTDLSKESAPFNKEKDIQFFDDCSTLQFDIPAKDFVIFFPQDGHAPCIGEGSIRKIVVKVIVK